MKEFSYQVRPGVLIPVTLREQMALDNWWNPTVEPAESFLERLRKEPEGIDFVILQENPELSQKDVWLAEREDVLRRFCDELRKATGDGSKKRQSGAKPAWYRDGSHEGAIFSHLTKWKRGEKLDPDSGAHPLVHAAWRCLAIACSENGNVPDDLRELPGE